MTGYKLDDLARAADVAPRTVRYYVQRGLLSAPAFRGKDTTYGPEHLLRLRAIKRLQEERLPLDEIQARLDSASPAALERIASSATSPKRTQHAPLPGPAPRPPPSLWERIVLLPGVELHVKGDVGAEARRVVEEIQTQFANDHEE